MDVELDVSTLQPDRGAASVFVIEMIYNTVFNTISDKFGVVEVCAVHSRVNRECRVDGHELFPIKFTHMIIQFIGRVGREHHYGFKDSQGSAAAKIGAVHHLEITFECHHAKA